ITTSEKIEENCSEESGEEDDKVEVKISWAAAEKCIETIIKFVEQNHSFSLQDVMHAHMVQNNLITKKLQSRKQGDFRKYLKKAVSSSAADAARVPSTSSAADDIEFEQIEQAKRAEEKRQKRIYDNWKKLIQGMLVKERVREMYGNVAPSDEEEDQKETETAKKTSEAKEKDTPRRKIKQEDIDAVRPPLITHQVRNLNIDLSSNVVEMAKKSRKRTMKTKNSIKRVVSKKGKTENTTGKDVKTEQVEEDNEESESDVEEKKAKIRAILQWGNKTVTANPDLSDDSDEERQSRPSSSHVGVPFSDPFYTVGEKQGQVKNKSGKGRKKSQAQEPSDCEEHVTSRSTSRSTTPEPDLGKAGCRRLSRRSAKQKIKTYKESDGENEGYISIDESDCEDKTYNPLKEKKAATHVLNLSEESNSD
ncbi:DNA repair protein complementing XP-C cells-like, partial [Homarus americanus]